MLEFFRQSAAITAAELNKIARDPTELFSRAVQPVLWLVIFGQVFSQVRAIPTGGISYLDFMAPGILAQSVLFSAIFYGIAVIWERDLGIVHKLLVTPAYRSALVLGKAVSAGLRGLVQAVIVYLVAWLLRIASALGRHGDTAGHAGCHPRLVHLLDFLSDHRLHRQDPRALHGHRPGADHAAVLREQRDLPDGDHARLAEGRRACSIR